VDVTDPDLNSPERPDFDPRLLAFDLSRGGHPFEFASNATIKEQA
jgi:hypothetical protein